MASCPIYIGSPAVSLINEGWPFFQNLGLTAFNLAQGLVHDLTDFNVDPVAFNYTFDPPANPDGFVAPDVPPDPNLVYDTSGFVDPGDPPPTGLQGNISFRPINPYTGPLSYNTKAGPPPTDQVPLKDFGSAPNIPDSYTLPVYVPFTNPDLPTLLPITLPALPAVNFPQFIAQAPIVDFTAPDGNITFNPQQYSSSELTAVQARLSQMLAGGTGLPAAVESALFARARAREDIIAAKATQEVYEEFASRGFDLPPGALNAKIAQIRQENQNKASSLSRDIYIKAADIEVENLRFSVQNGIALEGKLMDVFMNYQNLQLQAQKIMVDTVIALFNSKVTLFNARQQAYAVAAQVYRDQIQAELAKVEVYKAEVEAQRLIEEINKDRIGIYEAMIRAATLLIEQYKAQLEGVRIQTEIDKDRIEIFRAKISAYAEELKAYSEEWEAYRIQVEADSIGAKIVETQVQAYATYVGAVASGNNNLIAEANLGLEGQKTAMLGWRGKLDRLIAEVDAEAKRIQSGAMVYDGKAKIYAAGGQIAAAQADSNTREFTAIVEAGRASKEIALENVKAKVQQVIQIAQITVQQLEAAARTAAQLASGAMSAVHFGATASDASSVAQGSSCSTNYNISSSA